MSDEAVEAGAVGDFLQILEEHMKNCERAGKYIEADLAKKRLEELRQHEEQRREEGLRSRQVAQRLGIEEAHMLEFQQFNAMWDRTTREYEERAGELLEAMRQRHELDARNLRTKHASASLSLRQSSRLLDLRRIEQTLAKQGEYAEAQKIKVQADSLEAAEQSRAMAEREQQIAKAEAALISRQDTEVNALRQRIQSGAEEQRVARQHDLERLLRRYHNIKAELESQQNAERIRQRKGLALPTGASGGPRMSRSTLALPEPRTAGSAVAGGGPSCGRPSSARPAVPQRPGSARPAITSGEARESHAMASPMVPLR